MSDVGQERRPVWRALIPGAGTLLLASATGGMSGDIFNLYMTQTLGYEPKVLSWVYLGMLCSIPIQLLAPRLARRFGHRRVMVTGAALCLPALIVLLVVRPQEHLAGWQRPGQTAAIVAATALVEIAYSISFGTVWGAWVGEFSNRRDRPVLLAALRVCTQAVLGVAFLWQTVFQSGHVSAGFYHGVVVFLLVYLAGSVLIFVSLPGGDRDVSAAARAPIRWRLWWADPLHRFIAVGEALNFLVGVPLMSVYLVSVLNYPAALVSAALITRTVASLCLTLFLGRMIRSRGSAVIITTAMTAIIVVLVGWLVLPRYQGAAFLLPLALLLVPALQLGKAAFGICTSDIQYDLVPPEQRVETFTMIDLVSSSAMQVSALTAAYVVTLAERGIALDTPFLRIDAAKVWVAVGIVTVWYLGRTYRSLQAARAQDRPDSHQALEAHR